jgi:hypothetical protein
MNKILVMGKFTVEKDHWRAIKMMLKLEKGDTTKFTLVNKPDNHVLTREEAQEYVLVITTQSNPLVLKNVKKVLGDVPLVKPYRNKNKELTHFMLLNEVVVDYKYELFEVGNKRKQKPHNKKRNNRPEKKEDNAQQVDANENQKSLDEMLKVLDETPVQEKPKKRRRQ